MNPKKFFNSLDDYNTVQEVLDDNYESISNAIKHESYHLDYLNYDYFIEIIYNNQVVGFYSYEFYPFDKYRKIINEIYILPDFRGKGIVSKLIFEFLSDPNFFYYFRKSNKAFINLLIKNNLAINFNDMIFSFPRFYIELDEIFISNKIKRIYKKTDEKISFISNVYDNKLYTTLNLDNYSKITTIDEVFIPNIPRKNDILIYNLKKKFRKINVKYLMKLFFNMVSNFENLDQFELDCMNQINQNLSIENVIGDVENFNLEFQQELKHHNLSYDNGIEIYNHIRNSLKNNNLKLKSIKLRIKYLMNNFDKVSFKSEQNIIFNECPFCFEKIKLDISVCKNCGEVINEDEEISHTFSSIFGHFNDSIDSYVINPNDDDYEIKTFYKEYLNVNFNYHHFKSFYDQHSSDSIENIADDYLDSFF